MGVGRLSGLHSFSNKPHINARSTFSGFRCSDQTNYDSSGALHIERCGCDAVPPGKELMMKTYQVLFVSSSVFTLTGVQTSLFSSVQRKQIWNLVPHVSEDLTVEAGVARLCVIQ